KVESPGIGGCPGCADSTLNLDEIADSHLPALAGDLQSDRPGQRAERLRVDERSTLERTNRGFTFLPGGALRAVHVQGPRGDTSLQANGAFFDGHQPRHVIRPGEAAEPMMPGTAGRRAGQQQQYRGEARVPAQAAPP